jgi:hypothetical protein
MGWTRTAQPPSDREELGVFAALLAEILRLHSS